MNKIIIVLLICFVAVGLIFGCTETTKHLLDAAFKGEEEMLTGVVENLIVGQPVKVGTGIVELLMK